LTATANYRNTLSTVGFVVQKWQKAHVFEINVKVEVNNQN